MEQLGRRIGMGFNALSGVSNHDRYHVTNPIDKQQEMQDKQYGEEKLVYLLQIPWAGCGLQTPHLSVRLSIVVLADWQGLLRRYSANTTHKAASSPENEFLQHV